MCPHLNQTCPLDLVKHQLTSINEEKGHKVFVGYESEKNIWQANTNSIYHPMYKPPKVEGFITSNKHCVVVDANLTVCNKAFIRCTLTIQTYTDFIC